MTAHAHTKQWDAGLEARGSAFLMRYWEDALGAENVESLHVLTFLAMYCSGGNERLKDYLITPYFKQLHFLTWGY